MKKIVLLGHTVGVKFIIDSLISKSSEFRVVGIVTHPKEDHLRDLNLMSKRKGIYGDYSYNVFDVQKDYGIKIIEAKDVNDKETLNWIKKIDPSYIISVGCRNILKTKFLNIFPKKVLNIHTAPLPKYRGAASDSWMILNGELGKEQYGVCHFIDEGIDTGAIIAVSKYKLPKRAYPIDIHKIRMDVFQDIIIKTLKNLKNPDFKPKIQDPSKSTVFPRLFTPVDGKILFDLFNGNEIDLFVQAFGYPFEGAFCFLGDKKINILDAEFVKKKLFHSFANGLIFGKNLKGQYKVCVNDGFILIKKIEINGVEILQNKILRLGKFLK